MVFSYTNKISQVELLEKIIENISESTSKEISRLCYSAKVLNREGLFLDVQLLHSKEEIKKVALLQAKNINNPVASGDFGLVFQTTYVLDDFFEGLNIAQYENKENLSSFVFIPVTLNNNKLYKEDDTTFISSKEGDTSIVIAKDVVYTIEGKELKQKDLFKYLEDMQKAINKNVVTQTQNNATIQTALSGLGAPITLTPLEQFTEMFPWL